MTAPEAATTAVPWIAPDSWPALGHGDVHVWKANVTDWSGRVAELERLLDPEEQARAQRFRFFRDRRQYVIAHGLLRRVLARYLGRRPDRLEFGMGSAGKPFLLPDAGARPIEFNLAHSADVILMAATSGAIVGIDVERRSAGVEFDELIERFFSAHERAEFRRLPPATREAAFFACWSRKEAYIKATGLGVSLGLDYFDVTVAPEGPAAVLADRRDREADSAWQMIDLAVDSGYAGALVVGGSSCRPTGYLLAAESAILDRVLDEWESVAR